VRLAPDVWSVAPRQVSIALTNACDLSCAYCYAPKHPAILDAGRVCDWAAELAEAGCLGVGFGGGEPMLHRRLPQICRRLTDTTRLAVTLTTHAHRLTPELRTDLTGSVHFVRVSVDGVGATYERLRGRSYEQLRRQLDLVASTFPFGINCVVNASTVGDLDGVAELAARAGARELLFLPERAVGGRAGAEEHVRSALLSWMRCYDGPVPLTFDAEDTAELPVAQPLPKETGLRSYAHVDASGWLRATSYDTSGCQIGPSGVLAALERLRDAVAAPAGAAQ
jgi:sulfatase maturation enzyme AslB (radical SAM superfamily)